jgi:hypothetical protein
VRNDSTPHDTRDADHIWLRQSVTFSVNGQTRMLEMALPLRPGATPDEVDALLDEADAGMRRLSQRLDAHLAEVSAAPTSAAPIPAPISTPAPAPDQRAPAESPTPAPARRPAAPQAAEQPAPRAATPQPAPAVAPASAPASGGPDLTRPEFLTAVRDLGLDARTVMERLKVRSLDGLNLRESLELLRRQSLRDGAAPEPPALSPASADERAAALAAMPAPIGRADAARFEEEEDDGPTFEVSYPNPDDLPGLDDDIAAAEEEEFAPQELAPAAALDDVPDDLNVPPTAPATTPPEGQEPQEPPAIIRAREVIASLRAAHTGGQPSAQQRKAYANMVVGELGDAKAAGVIRAVWNLTPDKIGPEQYDELIRWGKLDTFADEVETVLNLLRAEWLAQHGGAQPAPASPTAKPDAPPAEPPTKPAPRRPAASEPASEPQEPPPAPRPAPRGRSASASSRADARSQGGA